MFSPPLSFPPPFVGDENWTQLFFLSFSGTPRISRQNPGISRQKIWFPWVSKDIPNFLDPTPSRGNVEDPHPIRRYLNQKLWVRIPFPSLTMFFPQKKTPLIFRRPPDYSSNLCPPETFAIWFFGGCFGPPSCCFLIQKAQKTPPKNHIADVLGGHRLDE